MLIVAPTQQQAALVGNAGQDEYALSITDAVKKLTIHKFYWDIPDDIFSVEEAEIEPSHYYLPSTVSFYSVNDYYKGLVAYTINPHTKFLQKIPLYSLYCRWKYHVG